MKEGGEDYQVSMMIYDCAGDASNQNLLKIYWQDVNVIILVYSIDSNRSFESLHNWIEAVNKTKRPNEVVHFALVASKADLGEQRMVPNGSGQRLKDEIN